MGHFKGLFFLFAILTVRPVLGQTIEVGFDLNVPTYSEDLSSPEYGLDFSSGFGLRVGVLSSEQGNVDNRLSWGLVLGYQTVSLKPNSLGFKEQQVSSKSVDFVVEHLLVKSGRFYVTGGVGAGYASFFDLKKIEPYDTFRLPIRGGFQASVGGNLGYLVTENAGIVAGVRSWVWSRGRNDTYPFKNGPVFMVGIRVSQPFD